MKAFLALLALVLAGCGGLKSGGYDNDAGTTNDASGCSAYIDFNPAMPTADAFSQIRASTNVVNPMGLVTYTWSITFQGQVVPFTYAAADQSQIDFVAAQAGYYSVSVRFSGPAPCSEADAQLNVGAPGANVVDYRVRVTPKGSSAPPQETLVEIHGGADYFRALSLDPGVVLNGFVRNGGTGVPAYLRFMPAASPKGIVEQFSAGDGSFSVRLLGQSHTVLIVPMVAGLAPRAVAWAPGQTTLAVDAGSLVTGNVKDPAGNNLVGAQVVLASGGVPSTLGTTDTSGNFTVRTSFVANATVDVTVTPPANRGLPRLTATVINGATYTIRYAASLATCDLGATPVQRAGANQPGAKVSVVGSLSSAGTVTAGATTTATGLVAIAATADGTGKLPSTLVPRGSLSAVTELAATDRAVSALDTSACAVAAIDAPAQVTATGTARNTSLVALAGVQIEAMPVGALAQAAAPPVLGATDASGHFSLALAANGHYDVRFVDPDTTHRAAPLLVPNVAAAGVPASARLPLALQLAGTISVSGDSTTQSGASVQVLCATCTGVDAARPVAETATSTTAAFQLAIPDPGTM